MHTRTLKISSAVQSALLVLFGAASAAQAITPLPRIQARQASPAGQFYNVASAATFAPLGSNYIRLDYVNGTAYHSTFTTGLYNAAAVDSALSVMHANGYNVVRVFIDPGDATHQAKGQYGSAGPASTNVPTLYAPFMANVIDFLERATNYGIYVIPVLDYVPFNSYYESLVDTGRPASIGGVNSFYLFSGAVTSKATYVKQFAMAVKAADSGALLPTVFSYELTNEAGCETVDPPFSMTSGTVTTQDGGTYNMAVASDRQQCMDSNTNAWITQCVNSIHSVDPNAMIGCSVFTFAAVGKTGPNGLMPVAGADGRYPARPYLLDQSALSYVDIHEYPQGPSWSLANDLNSSEFSSINPTVKPLLQGEFGADKRIYADSTSAANAMVAQVNNTNSLGFSGHLLWTWDDDTEPYWTMLDNNGALNAALSSKGSVSAITNGVYKLVNRNSGLALDDPNGASGSVIDQQPYGGANQQWTVTASGSYYTIKNSAGLALTGGSQVQLAAASATGGDNQLWSFTANGSYYLIKNKQTGQVADVYGASGSAGGPVGTWTTNGAERTRTGRLQPSPPVAAPAATQFNQGQYLGGEPVHHVAVEELLPHPAVPTATWFFTRVLDPADNHGGIWASLTASQPNGNYFTILQSDGNLCTYKGTGPNDNHGFVWCNFTQGNDFLQIMDSQQLQVISGTTVLWQTP